MTPLPSRPRRPRRGLRALGSVALAAVLAAPGLAWSADPVADLSRLSPCRLKGVEHEARCGSVRRPLDPAAPQGPSIEVHFAVLPALARHKRPDPVFFFAGGPGQSAIDLAGMVNTLFTRVLNRRDVVLIDQRGTGRSAPLQCEPERPGSPVSESVDTARQAERLRECLAQLKALPHGDLRQYTTTIAMADADAVRAALGVRQVNLVGGSYGTRAALEYQRLYPQHVRRSVIDGVAPPDMALPVSFSVDAQAAFDALLGWCEADAACRARHPSLRADWQRLLAGAPHALSLNDPVTGRPVRLTLDRDTLLGMVRLPLYVPALSAALPLAVSEASAGRFEPLMGLLSGMSSGPAARLAMGMHLSVVCAEDLPRLDQVADRPGTDFGTSMRTIYERLCTGWPRGTPPAAFYSIPRAASPVLLLSGTLDPVTPPRHGERVARALGPLARHVVVPNAGHGTISLPCMRDAVFRFVDAASDAEALAVDTQCVAALPRPTLFTPPGAQP